MLTPAAHQRFSDHTERPSSDLYYSPFLSRLNSAGNAIGTVMSTIDFAEGTSHLFDSTEARVSKPCTQTQSAREHQDANFHAPDKCAPRAQVLRDAGDPPQSVRE